MTTPARSAGVGGRRAPAAGGAGVPANGHEAYRRGLCRDCLAAWHSAGRTRCEACHETYTAAGVSEPARSTGRAAGTNPGRAVL